VEAQAALAWHAIRFDTYICAANIVPIVAIRVEHLPVLCVTYVDACYVTSRYF
jgi:hypothetical protein